MNQSDFSNISDLDLPEGTPVTGYKLVYHATDGNYYPYMNRNPFNLEYGIAHPDESIGGLPVTHEQLNAEERYKKDEPNVFVPSRRYMRMPRGYYYWQDKGVAEDYAKWAAPQPSMHFDKGGEEGLHSGRYELLRVEGEHVIKTENEKDIYNEGHVMDAMMFVDKTPLMAFDINGKEVDTMIPFEEHIKTSPPAFKRS